MLVGCLGACVRSPTCPQEARELAANTARFDAMVEEHVAAMRDKPPAQNTLGHALLKCIDPATGVAACGGGAG